MTHKHCLIAALCAALSFPTAAQNTIGGVQATVPQKEVERQSAFLDAERERMLGHHDKAIEAYKKFLYDNPDEGAAWYGLARCWVSKGDLVSGLDAIGKAVEKEPANVWYAIYQSDIYEKTGRLRDAIAVYEGLVKRNPRTSEFYLHLAYLYVSNADPKGGLKTLDKLEDIEGIQEEIIAKKHLIYVGMGDNRKAAAEYQKLVQAFPGEMTYRHRLADFYERIGDKAAARSTYEDILRLRPDDAAARLALIQPAKGQAGTSALSQLQPLIADAKVPIDAKVKELLPYLSQLQSGNPSLPVQNLLELADALHKAHPEDPKAWSLSGDMYYHADRLPEALTRYQQCIRLNPRVFSVWENTLAIQFAQRTYPELLKTAEQAMDAFPNQPRAYWYYALAAIELNQPDEALAQLDQASLMVANNPALATDLADAAGLALLRKKDYTAAVARYEQGLAKGGDKRADYLEHYGDALSSAGQRNKAIEQWKKAAALQPSPRLEQKISGN